MRTTSTILSNLQNQSYAENDELSQNGPNLLIYETSEVLDSSCHQNVATHFSLAKSSPNTCSFLEQGRHCERNIGRVTDSMTGAKKRN
jgi:hypothetical protein